MRKALALLACLLILAGCSDNRQPSYQASLDNPIVLKGTCANDKRVPCIHQDGRGQWFLLTSYSPGLARIALYDCREEDGSGSELPCKWDVSKYGNGDCDCRFLVWVR